MMSTILITITKRKTSEDEDFNHVDLLCNNLYADAFIQEEYCDFFSIDSFYFSNNLEFHNNEEKMFLNNPLDQPFVE